MEDGHYDLVRYSGHCELISANESLRKESSTRIQAQLKCLESKDSQWAPITSTLRQVKDILENPDPISRYKVEILNNAVLPYIEKMQSRVVLKLSRFQQVEAVVRVLFRNVRRSLPHEAHISTALLEIDAVIMLIRQEHAFWRSEFETLLTTEMKNQWDAIVGDMRVLLGTIGSKLFFYGLVDAIARPMLLVVPLVYICMDVFKLLQRISDHQPLGPATASAQDKQENKITIRIRIAKAFLLLLLIQRMLGVLEAFRFVGITAVIAGLAFHTLTFSESNLKRYAPLVAPHLMKLDRIVTMIQQVEDQWSGMTPARAYHPSEQNRTRDRDSVRGRIKKD